MTQQIKVRFKAYDHNLLDQTVREIVNAVKRTGADVNGPIPLPTQRTVITVLRSPHVDKKSREQFETRTHKRLMYIIDPTPQTMEALMRLEISAGSGGASVDLPGTSVISSRHGEMEVDLGDGSGDGVIDTGSGGVRITSQR